MTREEAIHELERMKTWSAELSDDEIEALVIAIKALDQEPCADAISRQAVMDCYKKWQPYMATRLFDFEKELKSLPSVTPKTEWIPLNCAPTVIEADKEEE